MKLYTRTGDQGQTSVIGKRVAKDDVRVEAYGTVDEANAVVGEAISRIDREKHGDLVQQLTEIQHELFDCGGDLAIAQPDPEKYPFKMTQEKVERLEKWIDQHTAEAPEIKRFILPGGHPASAALHLARTVVRRAERRVIRLAKDEPVNDAVIKYLNRLSDYMFAAARVINHREGVGDVEYVRSADVFKD